MKDKKMETNTKNNEPKKIAIYDFDGTLYNGETLSDFYFYCAKRKWRLYLWLPYLIPLLLLRKCRLISLKFFKEEAFRFFGKKLSKDDIYNFWKEKKKDFFPWVKKQLSEDRQKGYFLLCISATPENFLYGIVVKYLNFDAFIGTKLDLKDNRKIMGLNCKGKEKVVRFRSWLRKRNIKKYTVVKMVSDSIADKPLYDLAQEHYVVKSDGKMYKGIPKKHI